MDIVSRTDIGYYCLYFLPSVEPGTSHPSSTAQLTYSYIIEYNKKNILDISGSFLETDQGYSI